MKQKLMLDIGAGGNCQQGFVGVDKRELPGIQVVHDVEEFPWPFDDESAAVIMLSHLIEHIKPWLQIDFVNECWRVLEPGGYLLISTPYGGSYRYNQDPTHCSPWNEATVSYFVKGTPLYEVYKPKPWKAQKVNYFIHGDLEVVLIKDETDSTSKE
jgi:predicted SAM-dependent methyltransferase